MVNRLVPFFPIMLEARISCHDDDSASSPSLTSVLGHDTFQKTKVLPHPSSEKGCDRMADSRLTICAGMFGCLVIVATRATGTTYHVPGDLPTIQSALNLAQPGDSVVVAPGTYPENLIMGHGVVLLGEQGAETTLVDGRLLGPVISCESVNDFTVQGLTLLRGRNAAYPGGAGVAMNISRGDFLDCIFRDNQALRDGGGISVVDSDATILRCTFRDNSTNVQGGLDGGGIFCYRSFTLAEDCLIVNNRAHEGAGITVTQFSTAIIRRCILAENEATSVGVAGAGIAVLNSSVLAENNTLVGNITPLEGATVALVSGAIFFEQNIVAHSTGVGISCEAGNLACNDVWSSQNTNYEGCAPSSTNFSADPLFCDLLRFNLGLNETSPCAPANSPAGCGLIGALDVACGVIAVEPATWGRIKSHYAGSVSKGARSTAPH
jgi:hypothetical protein